MNKNQPISYKIKNSVICNIQALDELGLINDIDTVDCFLIDYLGFRCIFAEKRYRKKYNNKEYSWVDLQTTININPLLRITTIAGMLKRIEKLKFLKIINTVRMENKLFIKFTDKFILYYFKKEESCL